MKCTFTNLALRGIIMVRGKIKEKEWIVILSKEGIIETAFPPQKIEEYLSKRNAALLGKIGEIVK